MLVLRIALTLERKLTHMNFRHLLVTFAFLLMLIANRASVSFASTTEPNSPAPAVTLTTHIAENVSASVANDDGNLMTGKVKISSTDEKPITFDGKLDPVNVPTVGKELNGIEKPATEVVNPLLGNAASGAEPPAINLLQFNPNAGRGVSSIDTAAFQAAYDAVSPMGGVIDLPVPPHGKYLVSALPTITKPVFLRGLGGGDFGAFATDRFALDTPAQAKMVVIEYVGAAADSMINIKNVRGFRLENLVFDGANLVNHVAKADRMRGSQFRNVGLVNSLASAFILGSSSTVNNGSFWNEFYGLFLKGPTAFELNYFDGGTTGAYYNTFYNLRGEFTGAAKTFSVNVATEVVTANGHGYANGTMVLLTSNGVLPGNLASRKPYYVVNQNKETYQLALTRGGPAIDITSAGSGAHKVATPGIALISGDNNAFDHSFVWNYADTAPFANIGPGVFFGPFPDTYGSFNSHFDHLAAQSIVVSPDNLHPGVVENYDQVNLGRDPDDPAGGLTWTSNGAISVPGVGFADTNRWHLTKTLELTKLLPLTAGLTSTRANDVAGLFKSGASDKHTLLSVGRTAAEFHFAISAGLPAGVGFNLGDKAGDGVLMHGDNTKRLLLGFLGGAGLVMDLTKDLATVRKPFQVSSDGTTELHFDPAVGLLSLSGPRATLPAMPRLHFKFNGDPDAALGYSIYDHDNVAMGFDAYNDGKKWISSHSGSNFAFYKFSDELNVGYNSGVAKGSSFAGFNLTGVKFSKDGKLGIGTSPAAQLDTTGSVRFRKFGAGTATFDASGNLTSASDERLKEVVGIFARGLADLRGVEPILYKWNPDSGLETEVVYSGFSAQNVRAAIPEAVGVDGGGYLSLQDRALIATLVNAVKELDEKVAAQQVEIKKLRRQVVARSGRRR